MDEQIPKEEWQAPPLPEEIKQIENPPQMSEAATLGNIFFEPGKTFEDLRRKPRFVMAGIIIIIFVTLFQVLFIQKVGYERIVKERIEANPMTEQMSKEDKDKAISQQSSPVFKAIAYGVSPIVWVIIFLIGGLLYWLGANAMGGSARFLHGVSVWVYSSLPPVLVFMLANCLVLFLKAPDDIDIMRSQGGLIQANPSFFIDGKEQPVLAALLATFDLFSIWGWILAAIGLRIVAKISSGAAWGIILILELVGVTARVVMALLFG